MSDMKPCPFCGWNKARIYSRYIRTHYAYVDECKLTAECRRYYVRCNRCHAHGGSITGYELKSFHRVALMHYRWDKDDSPFFDPDNLETIEVKKPALPDWVRTKESLQVSAIARWNRRAE